MTTFRGESLSVLLLVLTMGGAAAGEPAESGTTLGKLFEVVSEVPIQIYGYVKMDAARDDSRTSDGNFARWAESEATSKDDDEFNMTAKQTRLGLKFGKVEGNGVEASGRFEIDFYGNDGAENKPAPMLRHAYLKLDWPEYDFSVIAGQTSDLISPLNPSTVNYTVLWWNGNIGYRRPQIRLTKGFNFEGTVKRVELQAAATRNIGHDGPFDPGDTGEDSGFPGLQWRASANFDLLTDKPTVLGVSGSWHEEEYDVDGDDNSEDYDSSSINLDLDLPVSDWLGFKAELFKGKNLDTFLGGIGQGLNAAQKNQISATGGWVAATITPPALEGWKFNLGLGLDDTENDDLIAGQRSRNFSYFGNAFYKINAAASMGLEILRLETDYVDQADGKATRLQLTFMYSF